MDIVRLNDIKKKASEQYQTKVQNITYVHEKEIRNVLRNCDVINPESIEEYIASGGYFAAFKVVSSMSNVSVIEEVSDSGLRGRGGGGFKTGLKWSFALKTESDQKYIVCNADEGDPGAFMDRSILEKDPHTVLEGMMIAGYAINASIGYIYVRAEYPLAAKRLQKAIDDATDLGLLGDNLFGSDFSFNIELRLGAGAFVCGEETALMASIEGERGTSRIKPPFPTTEGLYGKPTVINNVETLANVANIINKGAKWFRSIGTENSPGTKVFALAGKIKNTGLIEVPMGITLREIIFEIGEGVSKNRIFKAVLTGGPSGGCLTENHLDEIVDFDNLKSLGSMMGSGGMIVLDDRDCMVDIAKFYLEFTVEESCGKCTPCREGTIQLYKLLEKITNGLSSIRDLTKLKRLSNLVKNTSLCGLGQTAPNPVLSTIDNFYDEYLMHVEQKSCPSSVCKELINKYVITDDCVGCSLCKRSCPANAITGNKKEIHVIDINKCIKCGECLSICPFNAIITE